MSTITQRPQAPDLTELQQSIARGDVFAASFLDRSLQQRRNALAKANTVRERRSRLKRDIKAGRCEVHQLLDEPPEYIETMKVVDLLLAMPHIGRVKADHALGLCKISAAKTVRGLSRRERRELLRHLRPFGYRALGQDR